MAKCITMLAKRLRTGCCTRHVQRITTEHLLLGCSMVSPCFMQVDTRLVCVCACVYARTGICIQKQAGWIAVFDVLIGLQSHAMLE
jgi:hypothetical protein